MGKVVKIMVLIVEILMGLVVLGFIVMVVTGDREVMVDSEQMEIERKERLEKFREVDLHGFSAKDLNDKVVTSDIFKDNEITMINLWVTSCSSCISEMPTLNKLYENKPLKSNVISICVDSGESLKALRNAKKIAAKEKIKFLTLVPDEVLESKLTDMVHCFPTTVFVDKKGCIVGEPFTGCVSEDKYKEEIEKRIQMIYSKSYDLE